MAVANWNFDERTMIMLTEIVTDFYQFAEAANTEQFKLKVLQRIQPICELDGACWLSFVGPKLPIHEHHVFTYGLPADFWPGYQPLLQLSAAELFNQPSSNLVFMQSQKAHKHPDHLSIFLTEFGFERHSICLTEQGRTRHMLNIMLKTPSLLIDQQQIDILLYLFENAVKAFELHLQIRVTKQWQYLESFKAICDNSGNIVMSSCGFDECLQQQDSTLAPAQLRNIISNKSLPHKHTLGLFKLEVVRDFEFYLLELYRFDEQIERLSIAEKEVARLVLKGLTVKQVADARGVNFRTIANQLNRIYKKLEVNKSTDLVSILLQSRYRWFAQ